MSSQVKSSRDCTTHTQVTHGTRCVNTHSARVNAPNCVYAPGCVRLPPSARTRDQWQCAALTHAPAGSRPSRAHEATRVYAHECEDASRRTHQHQHSAGALTHSLACAHNLLCVFTHSPACTYLSQPSPSSLLVPKFGSQPSPSSREHVLDGDHRSPRAAVAWLLMPGPLDQLCGDRPPLKTADCSHP